MLSCSICGTTEKVSTKTLKCRYCYNKEYMKTYYPANKHKINEQKSEWYYKNRDVQLAKTKTRYEQNPQKAKAAAVRWKKRNPEKVNAYTTKRRSDKLNRTPNWESYSKIVEFYHNCPEGMTVDHIIPLKGKNVSGLNVSWNLQYLTPHENFSKINSFDGTYENSNWKKEN
jgi:hypothetical protein